MESENPAGPEEEKESGVYVCSNCGHALFHSSKKFNSGAGFPSFWRALPDHVEEKFLDTYGRERIQVLCKSCGQHLGHLFENKVTPTRIRYCINSESIRFQKELKFNG